MAVQFFRSPLLTKEFRATEAARYRLEEAQPHLGPAENQARQALSLIKEAQRLLQMFVPFQHWSTESKWEKVSPEEGLILAQDSLKRGIRMLERKMRSYGQAELQHILALLREALSLCASAELEYFFFRGLPRNYRPLFRIRFPSFADVIVPFFIAALLGYYRRIVICSDVPLEWLAFSLCFGLLLAWAFVLERGLYRPGVWWSKRQYIYRNFGLYAISLSGLALIWLIVKAWAWYLGIAAIVITGLAFPLLWRALRILLSPKKVLIRCNKNACYTLFVPTDEDSFRRS